MKKTIFSFLLVFVLLISTASIAFADDGEIYVDGIPKDSHKIKNKWDAVGTFTSGRDVSSSLIGRTWTYEIHVKQAMYGPYSKGVIEFVSGDDVIKAHVEDVKENYHYWSRTSIETIQENFAAVGWAEFRGEVYNFMLLYAEGGIWIILSECPYTTEWETGLVWLGSCRAYQVLSSPWPPSDAAYEFDPRAIH